MNGKRSPSLIGTTLLLIIAIAMAWFFIKYKKTKLKTRAEALQSAIDAIKSDYAFAKIKVLKKNKGKITVILSILDVNGKEAGDKTFTLAGNDPFIEARVIVAHNAEQQKAFVFPLRIYSDKIPPSKGQSITSLYVRDNFPLNYRKEKQSKTWTHGITALYQSAMKGKSVFPDSDSIDNIFSASVHLGLMGNWTVGSTYILSIHPNGGIELKEAE